MSEQDIIDALSGGLCKSSDLEAVTERMPEFLAAGFKRMAQRGSSTTQATETV